MRLFKQCIRGVGLALAMTLLFGACKPSDSSIAEAVKAKIAVVAQGLTVDVKDGVVTLGGEVADEAAKAAAGAAINDVKGVKSVVNNITLLPPPPPPAPPVVINPDDVLRKTVDSVFSAKGIKGITATVAEGVVTLTGDVKKADLVKVMQVANEAKPKKVLNQMKIIK
jgi:hyperosmotically inducible periplasmic protein